MLEVPIGSLWEYVGPQKHCLGMKHIALSDGDEIITWSQPLNFKRATTMRAGDTWQGPKKDFLQHFKPTTMDKTFSFV